ncbi:MAG: 2Fe-2S iron-sulfur cluster-binding protein [Gammaproteobacteria bacterium]
MKYGRFITSSQRISFNFAGRTYTGFAGDTVATALWREGVKTLSRSFKYHRRRGILSLCGADANTLMDIDDYPNMLADCTPITQNLVARPRHIAGTLEHDKLAVMGYFSRFLPPGFYYKAFYKPSGIWPKWEPLIRHLAGLGVVNQAAAPMAIEKKHAFCEVAVIGGGAAGLSAAVAAAQQGKRVILLDKNPKLGGALNWRGMTAEGQKLLDTAATADMQVLVNCEATGVFADHLIVAAQPQCGWRIRAERVIYAVGARELPAVFANNDLPGVMLISAALRLAFLYDLAAGQRAVILASDAADAEAVRALAAYGITIIAIFNLAGSAAPWAKDLAADGFAVHHHVSEFSAIGRQGVRGVRAIAENKAVNFSCDCILMNAARIPAAELPAAAGVTFLYDDFLCRPMTTDTAVIGAAGGRYDVADAMADGEQAGGTPRPRPPMDCVPSPPQAVLWDGKGKAFVDFDEDLQLRDIDDAIAEGFDDIQLLKRYTTAGMGPAQGKLTNILVARHLARRQQCAVSAVGQITARPPAAAETLAHLADEPQPIKRTVLHREHLHMSAQFMPAGAWLRPLSYLGEEHEAAAVRERAGIIDISTLGKLQVSGADAAILLERLYTGKFQKQKPGTVRYALMMDESGIITDDGVVARLDNQRFWVTTTTGNADTIYRQMLLWRARWNLRADITAMTSAFAAINLAGPEAPQLLAELGGDADLGYMRAAEINLGGAPAILLRVGFVGEKGYEIHLPMGYARSLWRQLLTKVQPFGVGAQRLLRLEKGHLIVGQDTDGLTTPLEADMEWALGRDKDFYLGKRALDIHRQRGIHRQMRGFVMDARWNKRVHEADLILDDNGHAAGHVTSVAYSPVLNCLIGLAFAPPTIPRNGGVLRLRTAGGEVMQAPTRQPPFYDPKGERQQ